MRRRCRDLDSELLWEFERFSLLSQLQTGALKDPRALHALHERALKQAVFGTELFRAFDMAVIFAQPLRDPQLAAALEPPDNDRPNLWSLKLRARAASGQRNEARAALEHVPAARLERLPCDRDYLGTLGALARGALDLNAPDYIEALYALLAPYPQQHFAVNTSFYCEGSVSELLGLLAAAKSLPERAREHLREAVGFSERAGLPGCARSAEAQLARVSAVTERF